MRNAFADELTNLAATDERVLLLAGDFWVTKNVSGRLLVGLRSPTPSLSRVGVAR